MTVAVLSEVLLRHSLIASSLRRLVLSYLDMSEGFDLEERIGCNAIVGSKDGKLGSFSRVNL